MVTHTKVDSGIAKRLKRKMNNRVTRQFFLIVCEGEKTEPNYFEAFKSEMEKGVIELEIIGTGANTKSLIEKTKKKTGKLGRKFDQIWVVFDRDDFPEGNFNNAIFSARKEGYHVAYSNEAFELWYLLHFEYCDTGISREQYWPKLSACLQKKYKKNDLSIYLLLKQYGDQEQAIKWAEKLYSLYDHKNPVDEKPSTTVHLLVKELNKFKKQPANPAIVN